MNSFVVLKIIYVYIYVHVYKHVQVYKMWIVDPQGKCYRLLPQGGDTT